MWIVTGDGFYSAVEDRKDAAMVWVRTRSKQHANVLAEHLRGANEEASVHTTPRADYPFRVHCEKVAFAQWLGDQAEAIDYDNFKSMLHARRGHADKLLAAAHDVWSVMRLHLQGLRT